MKTSTKIIIAVGAAGLVGTGIFLTVRHFKKRKASVQESDFSENKYVSDSEYYTQTPSATTSSAASTTTANNSGSGGTTAKINGSNFSVGYSFNKSEKTINVSAMGVSSGTPFRLSDVKKTQQYVMDYNPTLKDEMNKHGGADGKLGDCTAKCFAVMVCAMSQTEEKKKQLEEAMAKLGITKG